MDATATIATWGADRTRQITTPAELERTLDEVDADARSASRPIKVELTRASAGTLSLTVGADRSVLNHVPQNGDPPYLTSVGDDPQDRPFEYDVGDNHYTETAWRHAVPATEARRTAAHIVETGRLTRQVHWEEV